MKTLEVDSLRGKTGRIRVEDENYIIIYHKEDRGSSPAIDIDLKKRLIKIYDDETWTVLPMDTDSQFDEDARLISHIDQL